MPAAAHGQEELVFAGEVDSVDDVGFPRAPNDESRAAIDRQVPERGRMHGSNLALGSTREAAVHPITGEVARIRRLGKPRIISSRGCPFVEPVSDARSVRSTSPLRTGCTQ